MIELEHAFDYEARLKPPLPIGAGPYGTRMFLEVESGYLRGPLLSGRALSGGGDWVLVGDDGFGRVDVRAQVETDDGALLYVTYNGIIELNGAMREAMLSGGETGFGDQYFRISPRIETGDERYRALTQSTFVGRGRACAGPGVAYQVFRVA